MRSTYFLLNIALGSTTRILTLILPSSQPSSIPQSFDSFAELTVSNSIETMHTKHPAQPVIAALVRVQISNQFLAQISAELNHRFQKLSQSATSATLGAIISAGLATLMPWLVLSAGWNAAHAIKDCHELRELKKKFKSLDIHVKKKKILLGITKGAIMKFGTTIITIGHDDLAAAAADVPDWIRVAGNYTKQFAKTGWKFTLCRGKDIIDPTLAKKMTDEAEKTSNKMIHWRKKTSDLAGEPVQDIQKIEGLDTASDLVHSDGSVDHEHGWHDSPADITKQVILVGAEQVAVDSAYDKALETSVQTLEKPADTMAKKTCKFFGRKKAVKM